MSTFDEDLKALEARVEGLFRRKTPANTRLKAWLADMIKALQRKENIAENTQFLVGSEPPDTIP